MLAVALLIRHVGDGALEQHSGTALYASMVYAGVLFLRPRTAPLTAAAQFDPTDLAWYPAGVVPLLVLHTLLRAGPRPEPS